MIVDALVVYEPYSFKSGHKIEGWYNGAAKVTFPLTLTEDITLKANWVSGNSVYKGYRTFTLPTDLYRIKRVIFENEYEIIGDTDPFTTENEKLIVADRCGEYRNAICPKVYPFDTAYGMDYYNGYKTNGRVISTYPLLC